MYLTHLIEQMRAMFYVARYRIRMQFAVLKIKIALLVILSRLSETLVHEFVDTIEN